MKAFLIYINVLSTVLGTSAASANIIKQGKSLFLKKESLNYFLSCVSWCGKGARRKQKSLFFPSAAYNSDQFALSLSNAAPMLHSQTLRTS